MARFDINFTPVKRFVRGAHQADAGFIITAENAKEAKAAALRMLPSHFPGTAYRFQRIREIV